MRSLACCLGITKARDKPKLQLTSVIKTSECGHGVQVTWHTSTQLRNKITHMQSDSKRYLSYQKYEIIPRELRRGVYARTIPESLKKCNVQNTLRFQLISACTKSKIRVHTTCLRRGEYARTIPFFSNARPPTQLDHTVQPEGNLVAWRVNPLPKSTTQRLQKY